jgi:spore photoproduct lyase
MRVYQKEFKRLRSVESFVKNNFPRFGVNKKQEVKRLLYEISKRDNILPRTILVKARFADYARLKDYLIGKRYKDALLSGEPVRPYLSKIDLNPSDCPDLKERRFYPKEVFIEKKSSSGFLAHRFKNIFPKARFCEIASLKDYRGRHRAFGIEDYNRRQDTAFIVSEGYDFFKRCPCTKGALGCGYHIFNLGFGCVFECTYCFLQAYTNTPGIIFPANIGVFFDKFNFYKKTGMRIGTGEFGDSLALDDVTSYSPYIIEFFRRHQAVTFEFKTKSANIGNLLHARHAGNIVVSWSLNPQPIIEENEYFTAPLRDRLIAALKCSEAGYRVGFHFDPVIYFKGWEKEYGRLIEAVFSKIKPGDIAWISIGTFRFAPELKQVIERRFPANTILDEELFLGYDNKLRYSFSRRYGIYKEMAQMMFRHSRKLKLYLCMEEARMWKALKLRTQPLRAGAGYLVFMVLFLVNLW